MSNQEKELSFKRFKDSDALEVLSLQEGSYDLNPSGLKLNDIVIRSDGKVVGYGIIREFAEAVIVLDKNEDSRTKLRILKMLDNEAVKTCTQLKIEELHTFTNDPAFADTLRNLFGFQKITSIPLVKEIG